jgi:YHS domain-containing protein
MAKDPVCGMQVEEGKICSEYKGEKYCFCSVVCKEKFDREPEKYVGGEEKGCCG